MNIIIVGCGQVGSSLAAKLNEEGHNVTVIDSDKQLVDEISSKCDVMGIVGNGATHSVQQQAGVDHADLLIAVTGSDELNLLCCLIAKKNGHCETVARVTDPAYSTESGYLKDELGLAMLINPKLEVAKEIARILRFPGAIKIDTFAKGKVELLKFRVPDKSALIDASVREITTVLHCDVLICTIERGDDAFIAKADFVFRKGDVVSLIASPKSASEFFRKIGCRIHSVKDTMILGAGEITHYLCRELQGTGIRVKVVSDNETDCYDLADEWKTASVVLADETDRDMLIEEGLSDAGSVVSLLDSDEENIILSLFAKGECSGKIVTRINRPDYEDMIRHLDLDATVFPRTVMSEQIVRYVRAKEGTIGSNMETMYSVIPGKVEASEFMIKEPSALTGRPLLELHFKKNVLIAAIMRAGKVIIPRGHDTIEPGDSVVVVSEMMPLHDATDILE